MTELIVKILITALVNIPLYACVYIIWRKDCKEIGKDNLAVPLGDRMAAAFVMMTLPCLVLWAA